jgi:hypothetical protein
MPPRQRPLDIKFWLQVDKNGPTHPELGQCWMFKNAKGGRFNYGYVWHDKRLHRANRVSWKVHKGEIPSGMSVLHKCDLPYCVNPDHLFLGTQADNIKDMINKGREASVEETKHIGEDNGRAILTEEDVIRVLQWPYSYQGKLWKLAEELQVTKGTVESIRSGRNWKQLYHYHSKFGKVAEFCKRSREGRL